MSFFNPSCSPTQDNHITGSFIGQQVNARVDHELAAYYFNQCIDSNHYVRRLDTSLSRVVSTLQKDVFGNYDLAYLSNQVSVDFATLFFAQKTHALPKNREAQNLFQSYLEQDDKAQLLSDDTNAKEFYYVFVPGLFYQRNPERGGDFAAHRTLLKKMGLCTHLIETNEAGSVQENAQIIATELRIISRTHSKIVVISVSKGGPDLAYALGGLMSADEAKSIKAWISIGGVLRGSWIADQHLAGLKRLYAKTMLFFLGAKFDFVEDLSQAKSIPRHDSLQFPEDLLIIHYVGAPLSGQLTQRVKKTFKTLSEMGPNDGMTTLTDELTSQGIVITELGLDHYYSDPHIDKKAIALLHTALQIIHKKEGV